MMSRMKWKRSMVALEPVFCTFVYKYGADNGAFQLLNNVVTLILL